MPQETAGREQDDYLARTCISTEADLSIERGVGVAALPAACCYSDNTAWMFAARYVCRSKRVFQAVF